MHFTLGLIVCSKTYAIFNMLAAIAYNDYADRPRRQQQGIDNLKGEGATRAAKKKYSATKRL
jgi:hypothetical protein